MKIVAVGASGYIGSKVVELLLPRHEVIKVGHTRGDLTVDYTDNQSIRDMYESVGSFDAVVATVGGHDSHFGPFEQLSEEEFYIGIKRKLMGQVNLVLIGKDYINDGGSFTLTTGFLTQFPTPESCVTGTVNGAINSFVFSASTVMPRGIRINSVSPALIVEGPVTKGSRKVTLEQAGAAYVESMEGDATGQVLTVWNAE